MQETRHSISWGNMNAHGFIPAARVIGGLILLVALIPFSIAVYAFFSTRAFLARAVHCQGSVVELRSFQGEHGTMYTPIYTYKDSAGVERRESVGYSSNPPGYAVGDPISLLYDPQNPQEVCGDSFWALWIGPLIGVFIAVPIFVTALVFLVLIPYTIRKAFPKPSPGPFSTPPPLPAVTPPPLPQPDA